MLAKEIKIRNIKRQREFIKYMLERTHKDGDTSFRYVGHLLPEVSAHFTEEGFNVERISSDSIPDRMFGLPVYLFTIRDDVVLTAEELKAAEEIVYEPEEENKSNSFDEFLSAIRDCRPF